VIENSICEGTDFLKAALRSGVTSLQVVVVSARSVSWGSNEAVTLLCLVSSPSSATYRVKTEDLKLCFPPLTGSPVIQQLDLCFLYCFSGLLSSPIINVVVASKI